jgi:hypothetical protein
VETLLRTLPLDLTLIDGPTVTFTDTPELSPANDAETRENSMMAQTTMTMIEAVIPLNADLLHLIFPFTSIPVNGKSRLMEHR